MSAIPPAPAFSWTNVAQTGVFPNLGVGSVRYLTAGMSETVKAHEASTLYSPADTYPVMDAGPDLERTEERILESFPFSSERSPHVALFGPGPSKIDPLYARRLIDRIQSRFGRPSQLTLFDRDMREESLPFYEGLDWGDHRADYRFGSSGELKNVRNLRADLILAFHPNLIYDVLLDTLSENLVPGGLFLWQEDFCPYQTAGDLEVILQMLGRYFPPSFELIQEPIAGPLVPTYFSRILNSHIVSFLIQKQ
ncbi:MAG TPA: hypothetical protein VLJ37_08175 [bacterium]|nr:hypothetical protein [bacterium]